MQIECLTQDFSREVLREQPQNISAFAAQYFAMMLKSRRTDVTELMSMEEFETHLRTTLSSSVEDDLINQAMFKAALWDQTLGLSTAQRARAAVAMEEDSDGRLPFNMTVKLVAQALYGADTQPDLPEPALIVHGSTHDELVEVMLAVAETYDGDASSIPRANVATLLKSPDLGFTAAERQLVLGMTDKERIDLLAHAEDTVQLLASGSVCRLTRLHRPVHSELIETLMGIMSALDGKGGAQSGRLPLWTIRDGLHGADLGLTRLQIYCCLADAVLIEEDMTVDYGRLIKGPAALHLLHLAAPERFGALTSIAMPDMVLGVGPDGIAEQVSQALDDIAETRMENGNYAPIAVLHALMGDAMRLSHTEAMSLVAATDSVAGINGDELVACAYTVLCAYTREKHVQHAVAEDK